jgi:hypothetical protein
VTISALVGLISLVLMAPHLPKRHALWLSACNLCVGFVLIAYEVLRAP